jgi:hypothetical protein
VRCRHTSSTVAPAARRSNAARTTGPCVGVRLEHAVRALAVPGRDVPVRGDAAGERLHARAADPLHGRAPLVLGDRAHHRPGQPLARAAGADLADVDREDPPAGAFDALDRLGLRGEAAEQPVEVGADDDVRLARFDGVDGGAEAGPLVEGLPAADVELLLDAEEVEAGRVRTRRVSGRPARAGEANVSPSRPRVRETRTIPMARSYSAHGTD